MLKLNAVIRFGTLREVWPEIHSWLLRWCLGQGLTSRSILDSGPFRLGLRHDVCIGIVLHLNHKVAVLFKLRVAEDPVQRPFQVMILKKGNSQCFQCPGLITSWTFAPGVKHPGRKPELTGSKHLWVRSSDPATLPRIPHHCSHQKLHSKVSTCLSSALLQAGTNDKGCKVPKGRAVFLHSPFYSHSNYIYQWHLLQILCKIKVHIGLVPPCLKYRKNAEQMNV